MLLLHCPLAASVHFVFIEPYVKRSHPTSEGPSGLDIEKNGNTELPGDAGMAE
jgi:hypothetical protein